MPPVYRIIEVCIFALLNFLPFMLLALYPFWKNLRFSDVTTAILIVLLTIIQIWLGIWAAFFSHGIPDCSALPAQHFMLSFTFLQ